MNRKGQRQKTGLKIVAKSIGLFAYLLAVAAVVFVMTVTPAATAVVVVAFVIDDVLSIVVVICGFYHKNNCP